MVHDKRLKGTEGLENEKHGSAHDYKVWPLEGAILSLVRGHSVRETEGVKEAVWVCFPVFSLSHKVQIKAAVLNTV